MTSQFVFAPSRARADLPGMTQRHDLRTGMLCVGVLDGWIAHEFDLESALAAAQSKLDAWKHVHPGAAFALAAPAFAHADFTAAGQFADRLTAFGFDRNVTGIEIEETALAGARFEGLQRLRGKGFSLTLRSAQDFPLAFDGRIRGLFREVVMSAPDRLDPFFGAYAVEPPPATRRVFAARQAGMIVTAIDVKDAVHARALSAAGFDRGGGSCFGA